MISKYGEREHSKALGCLYDDVFGLILALDSGLLSHSGYYEVDSMVRNAAQSLGVRIPRGINISYNTFINLFKGKGATSVFSAMSGEYVDCGDLVINSGIKSLCKSRCSQGQLLMWAGLDQDIERQPNPWFLLNAFCDCVPIPKCGFAFEAMVLRALGYKPRRESIKIFSPYRHSESLNIIAGSYGFWGNDFYRVGISGRDRVAFHEDLERVFYSRMAEEATSLSKNYLDDGEYGCDNSGDIIPGTQKTIAESGLRPLTNRIFVDFYIPDVPPCLRKIFKRY